MKKKKLKRLTLSDLLENGALAGEVRKLQKSGSKVSIDKYLQMVQKIARKYPQEAFLQVKYAAILGDWGQIFPSAKEKQIKRKAVAILAKYKRNVKKYSPALSYLILNEYFYHSGRYRDQYMLGLDRLKKGFDGHFSAGVGGAFYAYELFMKGQKKRAHRYASSARVHWLTFEKPENTGGIFFALALALSGYPKEAQSAFDKRVRRDIHSKTVHSKYYQIQQKKLDKVAQILNRK